MTSPRPFFRPANPLPAWPVHLALVLILAGYFLPWLDHPAAGLTTIGIDVGEWIKFLPQMQSGELPTRDLFYLPPVLVGALVVLLTNGWRPAAYATWFQRLLGVAIAGLAFPSLDAIRFEPAGEWWLRLIFIGLVLAGAALLFLIPPLKIWLVDALVIALALAGSLLPGWVLLVVAPVAREWLHISFRIGAGFWLSTLGFLFAAAYTAAALWWRRSTDS